MNSTEELSVLDIGEVVDANGGTLATFDPTEASVEAWEVRVARLNALPDVLSALREARLTLTAHSNTDRVVRLVEAAMAVLEPAA